MMTTTQSRSKIFLADQRVFHETDLHIGWSIFNSRKFHDPCKMPLGNLYVVNDEFIDCDGSLVLEVSEDSCILLVPLLGDLRYKDEQVDEIVVEGGAMLIQQDAGCVFQLINPSREKFINVLQVWLKRDGEGAPGKVALSNPYNIPWEMNQLVPLLSQKYGAGIELKMGMFMGREDYVFHPSIPGKDIFVFVISGAFEVDGKLLHARDGLAAWSARTIEFEALSNHATIIFLETSF